LKREVSELEMKALRAQINPHFIFNSMNSINTMILEGDTEGASHYLSKFSKLIRLILENSENNSVSLQNELAMLESYIQLENLRFKGRIKYNIQVSETIDKENTTLPSMVLQPFIENAIWHGLMHKQSDVKGMINIAIAEEDDMLLCTIEDNGVGRDRAVKLEEKSILKTKSMGLQITENRLRLLNKNRPAKLIHIIDLKDSYDNASGTRVDIRIPLN
jgi:sensor histidine kinase YesM